MHFVSEKSLQRPGWIYDEHGVGYPEGMPPHINWSHIDGPLLYMSNGQLHWLTLWERLRCALRLDDVRSLDRKHIAAGRRS